jgi:hypothetical protein
MEDFKSHKKYVLAMQSRDWGTCDLIADEHKELVAEITRLKGQLLRAEGCLSAVIEDIEAPFNLGLADLNPHWVAYFRAKEYLARQILKEIEKND